ncbi:hypothetical protein GCM10010840_32430 [Deinococcus aerolatus]|uniref:Tfp pilus assembly protein PilX n=1 Tax=Deinococcus aerolatus TaxID=522487 RepID=A0ABQ2GEV1_9DEIO|nr:hypothetical protein GCM10010840_32430 [Deinococcus aerolatus]
MTGPAHASGDWATQGATMIIVVLFTLLLLAGILAATLQLGLSSRQNTGDQASTLVAQYAAESNISAVRSRFRDYQNLLTTNWTDSSGTTVTNLQMVWGTLPSMVEADAKAFCGQSGVSNPWKPASDFATPREQKDAELFPAAVECVAVAAPTANSYSIMADAVTPAAYTQLPASERPPVGASRAQIQNWWLTNMTNVSLGDIKYDIRPLRVVKLTASRYRFYMGVTSVSVKGDVDGARRFLSANRTTNGDWWFEITIPNPFENVLFINEWRSDDGGFYNDVIDGDLFTNQKVRMLFGVNKAVFKGKVRSVGCTSFPSTSAPLGSDCEKKDGAGFYGEYKTLIKPATAAVSSGIDAINADLRKKMETQGTKFDATGPKDVSFTESYQRLPVNNNDQRDTAIAGGLVLGENEAGVEMLAGDVNGNPLAEYDVDKSAWKEPTPTYQYIRIKTKDDSKRYNTSTWLEVDEKIYKDWPTEFRNSFNSTGLPPYYVRPKIVDNTREYRFGSDNILYMKSGSSWLPTGKTFNGVIYSDKDVAVSGPFRKETSTSADVSKMPPALASFARINVTGSDKITLNTDLTMSNTPCDNANSQKGCPKAGSLEPTNALVIFTPNKDITMSTLTQSEATYHAAIMASQGTFDVEDYDKRRVQGSRHVIGSVVEDRYGLNGVAQLSSGKVILTRGYGDDFSFDNRLRKDILPASPIVQIWGGADALNTQKRLTNLTWKQVNSGSF